MRLARDIARLVGREENGERGDLRGIPKPAHGLALDEAAAYVPERAAGLACQCDNALLKRGRIDGTGANRVHPDALLDKIGSDRLRQSDYGGFCRSLGPSVWPPPHSRNPPPPSAYQSPPPFDHPPQKTP